LISGFINGWLSSILTISIYPLEAAFTVKERGQDLVFEKKKKKIKNTRTTYSARYGLACFEY
jgi:hypothetical protein